MSVVLIAFLMAYIGMQVAGWALYAFVLFQSGADATEEVHRDKWGDEI